MENQAASGTGTQRDHSDFLSYFMKCTTYQYITSTTESTTPVQDFMPAIINILLKFSNKCSVAVILI
jgi:hypothetical protein